MRQITPIGYVNTGPMSHESGKLPLHVRGYEMNASLIHDWLESYAASGAARGTIRVRRCHLLRLAARCDLLTVDAREVESFLSSHDRLRPASRKSMLESLRSFFRWALAMHKRADDPTAGLRRVRIGRGVPRPITEEALRQAIHDADEETTLMLLLGAYAGLRRAEIAAVHARDLDGLVLTVLGKGNVTRRIPVHPMLAGRLCRVTGWAFPSVRKPGEHVTPDYISDRLERVLPAPYTPHSLRHRFATAAYRGTRDIRAVQELLGHASPATTAIYTLIDEDALTAAVLAVA